MMQILKILSLIQQNLGKFREFKEELESFRPYMSLKRFIEKWFTRAHII